MSSSTTIGSRPRASLAGVARASSAARPGVKAAPWRAGGVCAPRASATSSARSARTAAVQIGQPQGQRIGLEDVRCLARRAARVLQILVVVVDGWQARSRGDSKPRPGVQAEVAGVGAQHLDAPRMRVRQTPPRAGRAPDATRRRHVAVAAPGRKPLSSSPVRHATRPRGPLPSAPAGRSGAPSATLRLRPPAGGGQHGCRQGEFQERGAVLRAAWAGGARRRGRASVPGRRQAWRARVVSRAEPAEWRKRKGGHGCAVWRGHDRLSIGTSRRDALITPGKAGRDGPARAFSGRWATRCRRRAWPA